MSVAVQFRRGSTSEHGSFTGLVGEVTVDTDKKTAIVHDGSTQGGIELAKVSNLPTISTYGATLVDDTNASAARTTLGLAIGSDVQAFDSNTVKTNAAQVFTAQQTLAEIKEGVHTLATSGSISLDPANGAIQTCAGSGGLTFTSAFETGQSIVLHVSGSQTINWPTITWVTSAGNVVPTVTASDVYAIWQVGSTLYGAYVGNSV